MQDYTEFPKPIPHKHVTFIRQRDNSLAQELNVAFLPKSYLLPLASENKVNMSVSGVPTYNQTLSM